MTLEHTNTSEAWSINNKLYCSNWINGILLSIHPRTGEGKWALASATIKTIEPPNLNNRQCEGENGEWIRAREGPGREGVKGRGVQNSLTLMNEPVTACIKLRSNGRGARPDDRNQGGATWTGHHCEEVRQLRTHDWARHEHNMPGWQWRQIIKRSVIFSLLASIYISLAPSPPRQRSDNKHSADENL